MSVYSGFVVLVLPGVGVLGSWVLFVRWVRGGLLVGMCVVVRSYRFRRRRCVQYR